MSGQPNLPNSLSKEEEAIYRGFYNGRPSEGPASHSPSTRSPTRSSTLPPSIFRFHFGHSPNKQKTSSTQKSELEYQKYLNDAIKAKDGYESHFKQIDPYFCFQDDPFMSESAFLLESYESALQKTLRKLHREMESRGEEIIRSQKRVSSQLEEEIKTIQVDLSAIRGETKIVEGSNKDIKDALLIQGPNLDETYTDTSQCFNDLKNTVKDFLGKRGVDEEETLRELIQEMLTITKYDAVENDLKELETLLVKSEHKKWAKQLRLHVVKCYLDRETPAEQIDEYILRLDQSIQSSDLDKVYCLRKADQLSKYALAKEVYYSGDYSYEKVNEIYGKKLNKVEDVVDKGQEISQPVTPNPNKEDAEVKDTSKLIIGHSLHRSPAINQQGTADVDVQDLHPITTKRFTPVEWSRHMHEGKLCKTCTWCIHKVKCAEKSKDCGRCAELKEHKKRCAKNKVQCNLCKDVVNRRNARSIKTASMIQLE